MLSSFDATNQPKPRTPHFKKHPLLALGLWGMEVGLVGPAVLGLMVLGAIAEGKNQWPHLLADAPTTLAAMPGAAQEAHVMLLF